MKLLRNKSLFWINASVIEEVVDHHLFFLPGENQLAMFLKVSSDDLVASKIDGVDIDAIF